MSNAQKTKEQILDELTIENLRMAHQEYPRWMYHPDGRSELVSNEKEKAALGAEWCLLPQQAIDEKVKRDKRASDAFIAKTNAEAKAKEEADAKVEDEKEAARAAKKP